MDINVSQVSVVPKDDVDITSKTVILNKTGTSISPKIADINSRTKVEVDFTVSGNIVTKQ